MTEFSYWIQNHDYASKEVKGVCLSEAITAFHEFDWATEHEMYKEAEQDKNCPPGMGLHNGFAESNFNGVLLHVCPIDETSAFINFHYPRQKKIFGLFTRTVKAIEHVPSFPKKNVETLFQLLFQERVNEILEELRK